MTRCFWLKPEMAIKLQPYDATFKKQMDAAKEGMQNYRNALRELAK